MEWYGAQSKPVSASNIVIGQVWPLKQGERIIDCSHTPHVPRFDANACRGHPSEWVRTNFPRFDSVCTLCKQRIVLYASLEHYLTGDW